MNPKSKTPGSCSNSTGGDNQNISIPLYTPSQQNIQQMIARRYRISPAHASVVMGHFCGGVS